MTYSQCICLTYADWSPNKCCKSQKPILKLSLLITKWEATYLMYRYQWCWHVLSRKFMKPCSVQLHHLTECYQQAKWQKISNQLWSDIMVIISAQYSWPYSICKYRNTTITLIILLWQPPIDHLTFRTGRLTSNNRGNGHWLLHNLAW